MRTSGPRQSDVESHVWLTCTNELEEDVPPHGLVELEGADDDDEGLLIVKPRTNGGFVYINGPVKIPAGAKGLVTSDGNITIATDGTALAGETWGAEADSFLAVKDNAGFLILRDGDGPDEDDEDEDPLERAFADRPGGAGGGGGRPLVKCIATATAYGRLRVANMDGGIAGWTDGPEVRLAMLGEDGVDNAIIDRWFVKNWIYEATKAGTVTEDDVTFDIYWARPHSFRTMDICLDPDTLLMRKDCFAIPGWIIKEDVETCEPESDGGMTLEDGLTDLGTEDGGELVLE